MEKTLRLLDTFHARGSDGKTYCVHAYEHLVRLEGVPDPLGQWESTGLAEYKLSDGRHVATDAGGTLRLADGVTLLPEPSAAQA